MCQQILSASFEAHCIGARVCKAWAAIKQSTTCKPRSIDFESMSHCASVFPNGSNAFPEGFSLEVVLEFLEDFAPQDLSQLMVENDGTHTLTLPRNWDKFISAVGRFHRLTWLDILTDDAVYDWSLFSVLPSSMLHIDFWTLTNEFDDFGAELKCNNLSVFDRFKHLQLLRLRFDACLVPGGFSYTDDMCLPALQELYLENRKDGGRNRAPDLTFIPAACSVFCPLDVCTRSACRRLGYFGQT